MSETTGAAGPPVSDLTYRAVGLFARLADALERADFRRAATAHAELARIGYTVAVRPGPDAPPAGRPRMRLHTPQRPARGQGVAR
jgi:hypothetical protein